MKLRLLGINGPFPESRGATSGYLLETEDGLFQFDLGSGVLSVLTSLTAPESLDALFLSHWHFDHAADVPVLMYRLEALGKTLRVFAPEDAGSALFRLVSASSAFSLTPVKPGQQLSIGATSFSVTAARHPVPAVGYRISCGGRSLGYTGDTNTLPSLRDDFRGCHLLLADGMFSSALWAEDKPHLSAALAAQLAEDSCSDQLVITHLNPTIPPESLLREARSLHPATRLAESGLLLTV